MTKLLFKSLLFVFLLHGNLIAQQSVAPSFSGVQFNLRSVGFFHEHMINDRVTLRLQADLRVQLRTFGSDDDLEILLGLRPTLRAEPRYYYNLARREANGKKTTFNSGNFLGLKTDYQLPFYLASTNPEERVQSRLRIIPRWGIRRDLGNGWDFELGLGAGISARTNRFGTLRQITLNRVIDVEWKFGFRF